MKHIKLFESFLAEGKWSKIMKDVKANSETGPWSIIAVEGGKVIGQEIDIKVKDMIPAEYEAMKKAHPRAKLHIEDATGTVVWNESVVNEAKVDMNQLVDILANLEDAFTEEEFIEVGQDINVDADTMAKIFNGYWQIHPVERLHNTASDWKKWLRKNYKL